MAERSFNSIVNLIAGQDTVTAALKRVDSWLLDLNNHAITAGQQLDRLLQKTAQMGAAGGPTLRTAGPNEAEANAIRAQYDEFLRRTTGTGLTGAASISSMGAAMGIPGGRTVFSGASAAAAAQAATPIVESVQASVVQEVAKVARTARPPIAPMDLLPPTYRATSSGAIQGPGGRFASYAQMSDEIRRGAASSYRAETGGYQAFAIPEAGMAAANRRMGDLSADWTNPKDIERLSNELNKVSTASQGVGLNWGRMIGHIIVGMAVWQAMNAVANTILGTFSTITTETMRLDTASASLAATLGTTKESAKQYGQAMSMMGVAYGLTPEQTLPLAEYAGRVGRGAGAPNQNQLFDVATKLGQRTGEDPKKLMDDLNVTYRQTGISVTALGDMAVKAWANSGTAANEYLNILREVGPLAKESGIDIEKMAGIAAQAADRMGGSMSDAANTLTRLIKAVTDPNEAQKNVLLRYGIPYGPGTNVQGALGQVAGAGMSAADLAALGGRPGQPAVANDIRTMISTMLQYNGELQKGAGLQQQWNTATDTTQKSLDRLSAAFDVAAQRILSADIVKGTVAGLTAGLLAPSPAEAAALASKYKQETGKEAYTGGYPGVAGNMQGAMTAGFADYVGKNLPLIRTGRDLETLGEAAREAARALSMQQRGAETAPGGIGVSRVPEEMLKKAVPPEIPDFANVMNVTQYTRSEMQSALRMIPGMYQQDQMARAQVYRQAGIPQESIDKLLQEFRDKVAGSNVVLQSAGQMQLLQGPQAFYIQQAISAASARDASAGRLEALRDRLAQLREALDSLNETEKKRAQLEGQWNIPTGAKVLVPLTNESQALIKEHGGETDDQARQKSREAILKEIAAIEAKIKQEEALGTALQGLPTGLDGTNAAAGMLTKGLMDTNAAAIGAALALGQLGVPRTPVGQVAEGNAKAIDDALKRQQNPPRATRDLTQGFDWGTFLGGMGGQQATGMGSTPVTKALKEGFSSLKSEISVNVSSLPVNITSTLVLDSTIISQQVQKVMAQQVVDQARSTGFYSGTQ